MKTINIVSSQQLALPPALPYLDIVCIMLHKIIQYLYMTKNSTR